LVTVFSAALKSSTWQSLPHQKALKLLNDLCFPEQYPICAVHKTSCPQFVRKSFISKDFASSVTQEETFSWFDRTAAQLRETPFSQLLEMSKLVQSHLALLYQASFRDWPAKQGGPVGTKTSLPSAVVEPGVTLDERTSFSIAASNIFAESSEE
ncbi:NXRD1 protein, partial [Probosciger aterrimus]|nr:NXRD1 protein [Probosciger aterrimus]